ncbi:hypothetical protein ACRAWD_18015 [Caulobacter segnis]
MAVGANGWTHVYYASADNGIFKLFDSDGTAAGCVSWWKPAKAANAVVGDPAVVYSATGVGANVFFRTAQGELHRVWWDGATPHDDTWDKGVTSDPVAIIQEFDTIVSAFYTKPLQGTNQIYRAFVEGAGRRRWKPGRTARPMLQRLRATPSPWPGRPRARTPINMLCISSTAPPMGSCDG